MTTPTAPDQVVRLLATDGYDVHRLIYEAFVTAGGPTSTRRSRGAATSRSSCGASMFRPASPRECSSR